MVGSSRIRDLGDICLSLSVALASILMIYGASSLPPPRYEPLGSAALPQILAWILIAFSLAIAFGPMRRLFAGIYGEEKSSPPSESSLGEGTPSPVRGVVLFGLLLAYVAALDMGNVPFVIATTGFMAGVGLTLSSLNWRSGLIYGALGLVLSSVLSFVLYKYLYVSIG